MRRKPLRAARDPDSRIPMPPQADTTNMPGSIRPIPGQPTDAKSMFNHDMVGINDLEASKTFCDAVLGTLGIAPNVANRNRYFYRSAGGSFGITTPINGDEACHGSGRTIGPKMASPEQADAFHAAGIVNGGTTCEDSPGFRDGSVDKLYQAYIRDPYGNKLCALHRRLTA